MDYYIPTLEDYDRRIQEILSTITVTGPDGDKIPVNVQYYMPEPEREPDIDLKRPAITYYMYDVVEDFARESSLSFIKKWRDDEQEVDIVRPPTPVKLFYHFSVLTDYKQHQNEIIQQMNYLFPIRGYIDIDTPKGKAYYDFFRTQFQMADTYLEVPHGGSTGRRLLRVWYRYQLLTEVDENRPNTYKQVLEINPDINS